MTAGKKTSTSIGRVLADLKGDFPDVSISKIRFLEAEGLVRPQRTASGYRTFSSDDVERLRYILTAQRDRFWPLKVIREALDAMDRGLTPPMGPAEGDSARPRPPQQEDDPGLPTADELATPATLRLTARELREAADLDTATFEALTTYGLLRADGDGHFDEAALAVARAAGALAGYGVEPRHLRPFRTAADREIGLVQQIIRPSRGTSGRRGAADPTTEVLRQCIALHTALVRAGLWG